MKEEISIGNYDNISNTIPEEELDEMEEKEFLSIHDMVKLVKHMGTGDLELLLSGNEDNQNPLFVTVIENELKERIKENISIDFSPYAVGSNKVELSINDDELIQGGSN